MRACLAAVVLLAGCGGMQSGRDPELLPGACVSRCESARPQLKRDFNFTDLNCANLAIVGATSDAACGCALQRATNGLIGACRAPWRALEADAHFGVSGRHDRGSEKSPAATRERGPPRGGSRRPLIGIGL